MLATDTTMRRRFRRETLAEIKARGGLIAYRQAQIALERPDCRDIVGIAHALDLPPVPANAPEVAAQYLRENDPNAIWTPSV